MFPRYLFAAVLLSLSLTQGMAKHPEPVDAFPPFRLQPLPMTPDTLVRLTFDAGGQPMVQPAGMKATAVGVEPLPAARDLPGFDGLVRVDESGANKSSGVVEIADGAALLAKGAFTIDVVLRFSLGDEAFLSAGGGNSFLVSLLDRDAGTLTIKLPVAGKPVVLTGQGILEKVGPMGRERFQVITLTYDGAGTVVFYIDGIECYRGKAEITGPLDLKTGPLKIGKVASGKSRFAGDLAELRVRSGVQVPTAPMAALIKGGAAGWAFDATAPGAPTAWGYQPVTEADVFGAARSFGWTAKPQTMTDMWFVGERYSADPEVVIKQGSRRARAWTYRDVAILPSGQGFTAKVLPGKYVVTATVGRTDKPQFVGSVEANGTVLGTNLITLTERAGTSNDRTARGFVEVGGDGLLKFTATAREAEGDKTVGWMSFTAIPAPTLSVGRDGANLVWEGAGTAPEAFTKAAAAYAVHDWAGAFAAAGDIPDLLIRAETRAWIVGFPDLTDATTLDRLDAIQSDLLTYLRQKPDDINARYLEDLTLRMWHAANSYVYQRNTSRIYGPQKGRAWREGLNIALQVQPGEPYYGHARLLAANLIWQYGQQAGGYIDDTTWSVPLTHRDYAPPPPLFREVVAAYPDAILPKVFLSKSIRLKPGEEADPNDEGRVPIEKVIPIPEGAPEWAALQHRITTRVMDVVAYWYDNRMTPNGLLGGGFGDDVEMMRWWKTSILVADDQKALDGWRRLAETGWKNMGGQPMPEEMSDAEHVAEDFADSHGLQPLLQAGTDKFDLFMQRSRMLVPILKNVIMARDPQGYLVFRGYHYSRDKVRDEGDVPYNLRTLQPLLIYSFFRPEDKEATEIITEYARGWRDMTMKEFDGKPEGIVPMMIRPDRNSLKQARSEGKLAEPTSWVFPGYWTYKYPNSNNFYTLFLAAYYLTGDKSYLDPQKKAAEFLGLLKPGDESMSVTTGAMATNQTATGLGDYDPKPYEVGSKDWAIRINRKGLAKAAAQYRLATGDKAYDDILLVHGPAYTRYLILNERATTPQEKADATNALKPVFTNILDTLDYNEILRTRLPQSTDRVWVPGTDFLEATATGDVSGAPPVASRGEEEFWPMFGITWKNTGADVSMLVSKNATNGLEAYLYNFLETPKQISGHLWQLTPGKYTARLIASPNFEDGAVLSEKAFEVKEKGQLVDLDLPSRQQCRLIIEPAGS